MKAIKLQGVINSITIDCHNTSKELFYVKENLNLNFGQSENFILFSPVLFYLPSCIFCPIRWLLFILPSWILVQSQAELPSWIIVQSDGCFPSTILHFCPIRDDSPPACPFGIELSVLHYWRIQMEWRPLYLVHAHDFMSINWNM